ncbi:YhdT family protein [Neobacillus drentensis]|uniref:YhdT family protein n=1 Tax=Neobacillus drentensis TaxID=220684 RepID=UPI003000EBE2
MDKRFKIAHKEALIGVILVIINFGLWYGFGYGLGSTDVNDYTYVFGLPAWFFYSCILGSIIMIVLVIVTVKYIFQDIPFEANEEEHK